MRSRKITILLAAATSLLASAGLTGTASAGVLTTSASDCADQALSRPFTPWLDGASYTLNPGGDFESAMTGWTLSGGARVVTGNETYHVGRASDSRSLLLPSGSSAVSAPICVGLGHPTMRFFAKKNSGLLSTLAVSVRFETSLGAVVEAPIGVVAGGSSWNPTLPHPVVANLLPLLPGDRTAVAFRFTPLLGSWQIDDVYVDPWRMG